MNSTVKQVLTWVVPIGFVLTLIVVATSGEQRPPQAPLAKATEEEEPRVPELKVAVGFDGSDFAFVNNDVDLYNVGLEMNSGFLKGGFTVGLGTVKSKAMRTFSGASFQKSNGLRFHPLRDDPKFVTVRARDGKGEERRAFVEVRAVR